MEKSNIAILGGGFSGSLLGWILAKAGLSVTLVDRSQHPRFAIGESSTPLADCLLESIADEFNLPILRPLSRWGSWQQERPSLRSGKKRGFSYYQHQRGLPFTDTEHHPHSLLVAASENDTAADTHWHRGDVDSWFSHQAQSAGVRVLSPCAVRELQPTSSGWTIRTESSTLHAEQLIDATGPAGLLGDALGWKQATDLRNRNAAFFGHFRGVRSMDELIAESFAGCQDLGTPFYGDDAAQHHLLDNGWVWMLRFSQYPNSSDHLTSVGIVQPQSHFRDAVDERAPDAYSRAFEGLLASYPTLRDLMSESELIAPVGAHGQPRLGYIPCISRLWNRAGTTNAVMLPSTVGIIDPLHSTGIAHALSGVRLVARELLCEFESSHRPFDWQSTEYGQQVVEELRWIDELVHLGYVAHPRQPQEFPLYSAACSFYFVAAIHSERLLAETGEFPQGFLLNQNAELREAVTVFRDALQADARDARASARTAAETEKLVGLARRLIAPWNDVGLLDPASRNRLARSAAPK